MVTSTQRSAGVFRRILGWVAVLLLALAAGSPAQAQFGFGAVAFQPTIGSVLDGSALSVTPIVSADRRYVRLTMTPYFNTVQGFNTVIVPAAVSNGGIGAGGLGGIPGLGGAGGLGGLGGGGQGGFGSIGPGALGPPLVYRNVGTPRQALADGPSAAVPAEPVAVAVATNDPLALAYAQAGEPVPDGQEQGAPVAAPDRKAAASRSHSSRVNSGGSHAAPRQRVVRQP